MTGCSPPAAASATAAAAAVSLLLCLQANVGPVEWVLELRIVKLAQGSLHVVLSGIVHLSNGDVALNTTSPRPYIRGRST